MTDGAISKNGGSSQLGGANPFPGGGGIYVKSGSLMLTNVIVENNLAMGYGGGLLVNGGKMTMMGGTFTNNGVQTTSNGGGIYVNAGTLTLTKTKILNNYILPGAGAGNGGGMYLNGGIVKITSGSIKKNNGANQGGGIYNKAGSLTLKSDVTVTVNSAASQGGGLYLAIGSTTTFVGTINPWNPACTISGNTLPTNVARTQGYGVYAQVSPKRDAIIFNQAGAVDKNDPGGAFQTGQ
jgi:fibronectin-binding autotransporter adhesin